LFLWHSPMLLIILIAMMGPIATRLLLCSVILATCSVCFAQGYLPTAPPPDKKPCDVLPKAEAEAIMGQPADLRDNNPYQCGYVETGCTNKPPKNKQVRLGVHTNPAASPNDLADQWKNLADYPMPTRTSKNLPNFGDAAIWNWYQGPRRRTLRLQRRHDRGLSAGDRAARRCGVGAFEENCGQDVGGHRRDWVRL
jgi:hypothetical protein